jgi:hypothetical protein
MNCDALGMMCERCKKLVELEWATHKSWWMRRPIRELC